MPPARISTFLAICFGALGALFGLLRIIGFKSASFQAFAHLFDGGYIGAAIMAGCHRITGWKYYAVLGSSLAILELVMFLRDKFLH